MTKRRAVKPDPSRKLFEVLMPGSTRTSTPIAPGTRGPVDDRAQKFLADAHLACRRIDVKGLDGRQAGGVRHLVEADDRDADGGLVQGSKQDEPLVVVHDGFEPRLDRLGHGLAQHVQVAPALWGQGCLGASVELDERRQIAFGADAGPHLHVVVVLLGLDRLTPRRCHVRSSAGRSCEAPCGAAVSPTRACARPRARPTVSEASLSTTCDAARVS